MEEHSRKLGSRLPTGMHFDGTPLKDVLDNIAKAAGLKLQPWKDEGSQKVTIDVGARPWTRRSRPSCTRSMARAS